MSRRLVLLLCAALVLLALLLVAIGGFDPRGGPESANQHEHGRDAGSAIAEAARAGAASAPSGTAGGSAGPVATAADPRERHEDAALLVDERTGEGVPYLTVEFHARGEEAALARETTDESGRLARPFGLADGAYELVARDPYCALEERFEVELAGGREGPQLRVAVGPTYVLDLASDEEVVPDRLLARLTVDAPEGPGDLWQPIRTQPVLWVRFPLRVRGLPGYDGAAARLEVHRADGLLAGSAAVPRTEGSHVRPLAVRLASRAAIGGVVAGPDGRPIEGARLRLESGNGDGNDLGRFPGEQTLTDAEGRFAFGSLREGSWTLRVSRDSYVPIERVISLAPGQSDRARSVFGDGGEVSGRFISKRGVVVRPPRASLRAIDGSWEAIATPEDIEPVQIDEPGLGLVEFVGEFRFSGVPAGPTILELEGRGRRGTHSRIAWRPESVRLDDPSARVTFDAIFASAYARHVLRPIDAATRRPVEPFSVVEFTVPNREFETSDTHNEREQISFADTGVVPSARTISIEKDLGFRWMVVADAYRPACGDETGFEREETPDGAFWIREVPLDLGWGAMGQAFVEHEDGETAPCAGATILVDGKPHSATDSDGLFFLDLPAKPRRVDARFEGFHASVPRRWRHPQEHESPLVTGTVLGKDRYLKILLRRD